MKEKEMKDLKKKKMSTGKKREMLLFYTIMAPFLIMFIVIKLVPFLNGFYLSLTNYTGYNYERVRFIGIKNYARVLGDNDAMVALGRTLLVGCISVPIGLIVGLGSALLLNKARKGLSVFRTIIYLPAIIPSVAASLMWKIMFNQYAGGLNKVLSIFGIKPVQWLGYEYVFYALIIMLTWGSTGSLLINLSALKNVPAELYEAASIDGANGFQKFRKITIPMISPVLFFNLIMGIIGSMQLYTQPVLLASGNNGVLNRPLKPIYTFMVHAYQQILGYSRFGYGLAMIWILVIVINIMTVIVMKSQKYWVYYGD